MSMKDKFKEYLKKNKITYSQYLQSKHWKEIKNKKYTKNIKMYKCTVCSYRNDLHLHHRTYNRIGEEKLSDLVWLCKEHHEKLHNEFNRDTFEHKNLFEFTKKFIKRERKLPYICKK